MYRRSPAVSLLILCFLSTWLACSPSDRGGGDGPKLGAQLPNLLERGRLRNAPVAVAAPRSGWVIYAFAPDSAVSEGNSHRVEELAASLPSGWLLLGVPTSDQGLQPFLERRHVTIPVLTQAPAEDLAQYRVSRTPRTYILDEDWNLLEVLDGPYQGAVAKKLAERFDVQWKPLLPNGADGDRPNSPADPVREEPQRLCLDQQQRPYSPGAKAEVLGKTFECGAGGLWILVP